MADINGSNTQPESSLLGRAWHDMEHPLDTAARVLHKVEHAAENAVEIVQNKVRAVEDQAADSWNHSTLGKAFHAATHPAETATKLAHKAEDYVQQQVAQSPIGQMLGINPPDSHAGAPSANGDKKDGKQKSIFGELGSMLEMGPLGLIGLVIAFFGSLITSFGSNKFGGMLTNMGHELEGMAGPANKDNKPALAAGNTPALAPVNG